MLFSWHRISKQQSLSPAHACRSLRSLSLLHTFSLILLHAIPVAENFQHGSVRTDAELVWVLDPIDVPGRSSQASRSSGL